MVVILTAIWTSMYGAGFGESFVYGLGVLGVIAGLVAALVYTIHKRYS